MIPELVKRDKILGSTAYILAIYGFSRRGARGVFETVAALSQRAFAGSMRADSKRLTASRIEEIYEAYLKANHILARPSDHRRASLRRASLLPGETLRGLAAELLSNDGELSRERIEARLDLHASSELELTPLGKRAFEKWLQGAIEPGEKN